MSSNGNKAFASYNYRETKEYERHEQLLCKLRKMSTEEKLKTLVEAGIVNEEGELTERYGGTATDTKD